MPKVSGRTVAASVCVFGIVALACEADTSPVGRAVIRARRRRAVRPHPPRLAVARAVVAVTVVGARLGAELVRAVNATPAGLARAGQRGVALALADDLAALRVGQEIQSKFGKYLDVLVDTILNFRMAYASSNRSISERVRAISHSALRIFHSNQNHL